MKKFISVILALIMSVTAFGINTEAASYEVGISKSYKNGYTYVTLKPSEGTVYYTTDGTKADNKDKKYKKKIKITEPTTLKMTIYSDGEAVKSFTAKIAVRTETPEVTVKELEGNKFELKFSAASKAAVYYTTDGSTPSEDNGKKLGKSKKITVDGGTKVKAVAVKEGWKNSKVLTEELPDNSGKEYIEEVLRLINIERRRYGLVEFTTTDEHLEAADIRAQELTEKYSHTRPNGTSCSTVLKECGIKYSAMGENIAAGYVSPQSVVNGWMSSEGHRNNILNARYKRIGIGFAETRGGYRQYWAQLFTN